MQRIKSFVYDCITSIVKLFSEKQNKKTLLLVKTNEIGDYVLWRNMLPFIRSAEKYRDYNITLLGNIAWKSFFDTYDAAFVDNVVWVNKQDFKKKMLYRFKLLRQIKQKGFEVVVNVVTSRCKRDDDAFVLVCNKAFKIGNTSDATNVYPFEMGYDKNLYNVLYGTQAAQFEFFKNVSFTEQLLQLKLPISLKPSIEVNGDIPADLKGKKYFVVFTGSSRSEKIWPTESFVKVAEYVAQKMGYIPVLGGSKDDITYVEKFIALYKGAYVNLCGKTSLIAFAAVLQQAQLLVSIDTGAVHIAAAVGCPVYGVFNGTRLGRFAPYPTEANNRFYALFPDSLDADIKAGNYAPHQGMSAIPYAAVSAQKVIDKIQETFAVKN